MKRSEARELQEAYVTWGPVRQLLIDSRASLVGAAGKEPARLNKGGSRATIWNIFWRAVRKHSDGEPIRSHHEIIVRNVLREFGTTTKRPRTQQPLPTIYHEELDPLEDDE